MKRKNTMGITRKKYGLGGTATYGNEIKHDNISDGEVNKWGDVGTSTLTGALSGAAAGTAIAPGIGTAIGAGIGALTSFVGGLFGSRKKKKALAAQRESERQNTIQAMNTKLENDYYNIKQDTYTDFSEGDGFYAKFGGLIGRKRLSAGGTISPNSSNTQVVYGNTHEQTNPLTGETGVPYGDVEVEGGGIKNGVAKAGETIKEVGGQARVYSDTLRFPGSNVTFAEASKRIGDEKGNIEKNNKSLEAVIDKSLTNLDKSKMNKAKLGTKIRNIEKTIFDYNTNTGKIAELNSIEDRLYETQEVKAESLGLRGNPYKLKHGGFTITDPTQDIGSTVYSYGAVKSDVKLPTIKGDVVDEAKSNFNPSYGNISNYATLANFGLNALNAYSTSKDIDFEEKFKLPDMAAEEYVQYNNRYNITNQLSEVDSDQATAERYIKANSSNSQVARNAITDLSIKSNKVRGGLYHTKNTTESQLSDRNVEARHNTTQRNNQIGYQNQLNKYNKSIDINSKRSANKNQFIQSVQGVIDNSMSDRMQLYKIGSQNILQASKADTERLQTLYNDIWGVNLTELKNKFNPFKKRR